MPMVNLIPWDHPARSRSPSHPQPREVNHAKSNAVSRGVPAAIPEGSIKSVLIHLTQLLCNPSRKSIDVRKDLKLLRDRTISANKEHAITNALPSTAAAASRAGSLGRHHNASDTTARYRISERESASVLYILLSSMCFVQESPPKFHESPLEHHIQKLLEHSKNGDRRQFHEAVEEVVQHLLLFTPMHPPVVLEPEEKDSPVVSPRKESSDSAVVFFSPDASPKRTRQGTSSFARRAPSNGRSMERPPNLPMPRPERGIPAPQNVSVVETERRSGALDFCADFLQMHKGRPAVDPVVWQRWIDIIEQEYVGWAEEYALSGRRGSSAVRARSSSNGRLSRSASMSRSDSKKFAADGDELAALSNSALGGRQPSDGPSGGGEHPSFLDETDKATRAPRLLLRPYWQNPTNLYAQFCTFLLVIFFTKGVNTENYEARLLKLTQYFHFHFDVHHCTDPIPLMCPVQDHGHESQRFQNVVETDNINVNTDSTNTNNNVSGLTPSEHNPVSSSKDVHYDPNQIVQRCDRQVREFGSRRRPENSSLKLSTHVNTGSSSVFLFQTPEVLRSSGHMSYPDGDTPGRKTLWATQPKERFTVQQQHYTAAQVAGPPIKVRAMVPPGIQLSPA